MATKPTDNTDKKLVKDMLARLGTDTVDTLPTGVQDMLHQISGIWEKGNAVDTTDKQAQAEAKPPPSKKGKSAAGTPCSQAHAPEEQPLARKTPVAIALADAPPVPATLIDEYDDGEATLGQLCS